MNQYYVYILSSRSSVLYIGMTNDLERRVAEHEERLVPGFTAKYNVNCLVCYQAFDTPDEAIAAEKKLKGWRREKKVALIEPENPQWKDLSEDWYDDRPTMPQYHGAESNLKRPNAQSDVP